VTIFGRTFDGQELFLLISMSATLVLWLFVLRGKRAEDRWLKRQQEENRPKDPPPARPGSGPWG